MTASSIIVLILLIVAVLTTIVFSIGVLVMTDALQRLHFTTPPAALVPPLVVIAVWIADSQTQSRVKALLIGIALFAANAMIGHTNGRAFRLRQKAHFDPRPEEKIAVVGRDEFAGEREIPVVEP